MLFLSSHKYSFTRGINRSGRGIQRGILSYLTPLTFTQRMDGQICLHLVILLSCDLKSCCIVVDSSSSDDESHAVWLLTVPAVMMRSCCIVVDSSSSDDESHAVLLLTVPAVMMRTDDKVQQPIRTLCGEELCYSGVVYVEVMPCACAAETAMRTFTKSLIDSNPKHPPNKQASDFHRPSVQSCSLWRLLVVLKSAIFNGLAAYNRLPVVVGYLAPHLHVEQARYGSNTRARPHYVRPTVLLQRHSYTAHTRGFLQFTLILVQRLETDAVTDLTPGIWSHVRLKRSKKRDFVADFLSLPTNTVHISFMLYKT
ncbi:hypothetical protein J6590_068074 [Homalodisca vitripennis]|nr:hypothetical protein J6590_068074 [Homalodisca vitripennis]